MTYHISQVSVRVRVTVRVRVRARARVGSRSPAVPMLHTPMCFVSPARTRPSTVRLRVC